MFLKVFLITLSTLCFSETCFDLRHKSQELLQDSFNHKENYRVISQCNELDIAKFYAQEYYLKCSKDFNEEQRLLNIILRELVVYCDK